MCSYCDKTKRKLFDRSSYGYIDSDAPNGPMFVTNYRNFVSIFEINFCPMCGKNLVKESEDGQSGS